MISLSNYVNSTKPLLHANSAWIWTDTFTNWTSIPTESPCPTSIQPPEILQQCTLRGENEVVIVTQNFLDFTTCTSALNIKNYAWTKIQTQNLLPLAGFILTGIDSSRVFYLGGFTNQVNSDNRTVFELRNNHWELTETRLTFGITGFNALFMDSRLNLTKCVSDRQVWPHE